MSQGDAQKRIQAAYVLISDAELFSLKKLESARDLVAGINPKVDKAFTVAIGAFAKVEKVHRGDVLHLSVEAMPEKTEVQKKRKKAVIFFLNTFETLKSEIKRVQSELQGQTKKTKNDQAKSVGRILVGAKGPFGIGTIVALAIVGAMFLLAKPQSSSLQQSGANPKPQGIPFQGKIIPLTEVKSMKGSECDQDIHYHAKDHISAKTTDGTIVYDPGGCGFGKVKEVTLVNLQ